MEDTTIRYGVYAEDKTGWADWDGISDTVEEAEVCYKGYKQDANTKMAILAEYVIDNRNGEARMGTELATFAAMED